MTFDKIATGDGWIDQIYIYLYTCIFKSLFGSSIGYIEGQGDNNRETKPLEG